MDNINYDYEIEKQAHPENSDYDEAEYQMAEDEVSENE